MVQTDIEVAHPEVVFYDFYAAWDKPIANDKAQYLGENRSTIGRKSCNVVTNTLKKTGLAS